MRGRRGTSAALSPRSRRRGRPGITGPPPGGVVAGRHAGDRLGLTRQPARCSGKAGGWRHSDARPARRGRKRRTARARLPGGSSARCRVASGDCCWLISVGGILARVSDCFARSVLLGEILGASGGRRVAWPEDQWEVLLHGVIAGPRAAASRRQTDASRGAGTELHGAPGVDFRSSGSAKWQNPGAWFAICASPRRRL